MTFSDLPTNWLSRPLTDPVLAANVVDLFVTAAERRQGVLAALICDRRARFRTSIHLDLPRDAPLASPKSCVRALAPLIPVLESRPDGALILALGRPKPDPPSDHDWTEAAIQTCRSASIHLLAFYLATPTDLHAVPLPTPPRTTRPRLRTTPPGPAQPRLRTTPPSPAQPRLTASPPSPAALPLATTSPCPAEPLPTAQQQLAGRALLAS
ncbi:hypothetical protein OHA70_34955 [Kribbella sp. NBC_00382]|uniref:hypothetical protein n=1 Tax=Kribbella sp. NBC_00382 TaxID=2975967 RepID=UPI002E1C8211